MRNEQVPASISDNGKLGSDYGSEEEIVISGMAGVFPDTDNVQQLGKKLLAKEDFITDDDRRWKADNFLEIPHKTGKLKEINKFDAAFFGVPKNKVEAMDPMGRILLEKAYEAIIDAGYNPKELKGSSAGVFIGSVNSEMESAVMYGKAPWNRYSLPGFNRSMLANRISFFLDFNGPSYSLDTACSSSAYGFEQAYRAIKSGLCDAAIVGGCNICFNPMISFLLSQLGVLNPDGKCVAFDEFANGYVRSECVAVLFLQKKKNARRMYARIVHADTFSEGYKEVGLHEPSSEKQGMFLKRFYQTCHVDPRDVQFLEAHGTGTKIGDPAELKAFETVFLPGRVEPLKIGSVKSNMGHTEPASGICSIMKVILSYEMGVILPNMHFQTPRSDVEGLRNEKMIVVTEPVPWEGGLAGINNFGLGGTDCHILLNANPKMKVNDGTPLDDLPRLVTASGRTEEAVDVILKDIEGRPIDSEYVRLLHGIQSEDIPGHLYRGYTLLQKQNKTLLRSIKNFPGEKRPIWFVFSGMGSLWPRMGKSLMEIPVCAESINKCNRVLESKNINLLQIITEDNALIFDNVLNSFVGIVAIQIALTDLLATIEIVPNGFIGHSLGELACAYADRCLTAEQTILLAYYRGLAILESELIKGSVAAIGVGHGTIREMIPTEVDIACHNTRENCTISGPSEIVKTFIGTLRKKHIFAQEVKSSDIAFHSRYINKCGLKFSEYAKRVISNPKLRSSKWISSTFLDEGVEGAKHGSVDYFVKNLLGTVFFEEACGHIPKNAIIIEIAPHGLLQSLLKYSLSESIISIPLTSRTHPNNATHLLCAVGKIFEAGANPKIWKLYPTIEFPVSKGTSMISPLVKWDHREEWYAFEHENRTNNAIGEINNSVPLMNGKEEKFYSNQMTNGKSLIKDIKPDYEEENKTLSEALAHMLGLTELKTVNLHKTFAEFGMDSTMNAEIRQKFKDDYNISLSMQDIRSLTFSRLYELEIELEERKGSLSSLYINNQNEAVTAVKMIDEVSKIPAKITNPTTIIPYAI